MGWEFGLSRCKLSYIGWINRKVLQHTELYSVYSVTIHDGEEDEKNVCVCVCGCVCVCVYS